MQQRKLRIVTANPVEGERYYLRMLLCHIPGPESYADLRTINGYEYQTNKQAAVACGFLEDDKSNEKCMQEGSAYRMPDSLRQMFCTILAYCSPTNPKELFLQFENELTEDFVKIRKLSKESARQLLLNVLNSELESIGKGIKDYQLTDLLIQDRVTEKYCKEIRDEIEITVSEKRPFKY